MLEKIHNTTFLTPCDSTVGKNNSAASISPDMSGQEVVELNFMSFIPVSSGGLRFKILRFLYVFCTNPLDD